MIPGETILSGAADVCPDCGAYLTITPQRWSGAGAAIASWCDCGPSSRESGYYPSVEQAAAAFDAEPILDHEQAVALAGSIPGLNDWLLYVEANPREFADKPQRLHVRMIQREPNLAPTWAR